MVWNIYTKLVPAKITSFSGKNIFDMRGEIGIFFSLQRQIKITLLFNCENDIKYIFAFENPT